MSRRPKGAGDYVVGKGRPPVATRFKPGQSGNSKGRPKKVKTVDASLQEVLNRKLTVRENGRPRTRTLQEVIIFNLANAAARGDYKAVQLVLALQKQYQNSSDTTVDPESLQPDDEAILRDYLARVGVTQQNLNNPNTENQGGPDDPEL